MRTDLVETMDAVKIGPPLAVRPVRASALPTDPALAGPAESPNEFIGRWLVVTTLSIVAARILVTLPVLIWDPRTSNLPPGMRILEALVLGGVAAGPQYLVLRRSLPGAGWWVAVSMVGALAASYAALSASRVSVLVLTFLGVGDESLAPFIIFDLRLCIAFALQAVVLRRWFPRPGAWVLMILASLAVANVTGWVIWKAALPVVGPVLGTTLPLGRAALCGLLEGLLVGGSTGWLLARWTGARRSRPSESTVWMGGG